jgi:hypothetical protein
VFADQLRGGIGLHPSDEQDNRTWREARLLCEALHGAAVAAPLGFRESLNCGFGEQLYCESLFNS